MPDDSAEIERWIFNYVNIERRKAGRALLKTNWGLVRVARGHSREMATKHNIWHGQGVYLAKHRISYRSFWQFLYRLVFQYRGCSGENVGLMYRGRVKGYRFPIRTNKQIAWAQSRAWMNSPGHRENILRPSFKMIGIGVKQNKNGFYCTQLFYG